MLNFIYQGHVYIPEENITIFLEIGKELEISGITEIKNLSSALKSSLDCTNAIKILSNKDNMEADTKEKIKAENTESVVESITDLDIDCTLNEGVEKNKASRILAESINENELHSTMDLKKIIYGTDINVSGTYIQPYFNFCNKIFNSLASLKVQKATIHEGVNYPCDQFDYKLTNKGHLIRHTQSIHDGKW